jgi:hypothetical protein
LPWEDGWVPSREEAEAVIAAILHEQLGPLLALND